MGRIQQKERTLGHAERGRFQGGIDPAVTDAHLDKIRSASEIDSGKIQVQKNLRAGRVVGIGENALGGGLGFETARTTRLLRRKRSEFARVGVKGQMVEDVARIGFRLLS